MAAVPTSTFEFGPVDLLNTIVRFLGHIRGCKSNLLPKLLQHSEGILGSMSISPQIDMRWSPLGDLSAPALEFMDDYTDAQQDIQADGDFERTAADFTDWDCSIFTGLDEFPSQLEGSKLSESDVEKSHPASEGLLELSLTEKSPSSYGRNH